MNKIKTFLCAAGGLLLCGLCGCGLLSGDANTTYTVSQQQEQINQQGNRIHLTYPALSGQTESMDIPNALIRDGVRRYITDYYGETVSGLTLELEYQVAYSSNDLLSVAFSGVGMVENAAHPNNHRFSVNIDVPGRRRVQARGIYQLNEDFIRVVKNALTAQHPAVSEIVDEQQLFDLFEARDSLTGGGVSYYAADSFVLIVPAPHVLGDYVEVKIRYEELERYRKGDIGLPSAA